VSAHPIRRTLLSAIIAASCLAACSARYNVRDAGGTEAAAVRLDRSKLVFVAVPQDGAYGSKVYGGSGQSVAQAIATAFSETASRVRVGDRYGKSEDAIAAGKAAGAGYVVIPVITHWEPRNTAWSSLPSRMAVRVAIVDAANGNELTSSAIEGRSRIVSLTSTSPDSLLRVPLSQYVHGLY
jgi:uncharacterized protein DUF4823